MQRLSLKSGLELAPVVDVVFLLLTFFLLSANLEKTREIALELPAATGSSVTENVALKINIQKDGTLFLAGLPVDRPGLEKALGQIQTPAETECQLAADQGVAYGTVMEVLSLLQKHNILRIQLLSREP